MTSKTLKAIQERNLCLQGSLLVSVNTNPSLISFRYTGSPHLLQNWNVKYPPPPGLPRAVLLPSFARQNAELLRLRAGNVDSTRAKTRPSYSCQTLRVALRFSHSLIIRKENTNEINV